MHHAVIEITDRNISVTLHSTPMEAENYAVSIAKENTDYSESEIREHLRCYDRHEEGDYAVWVANAHELTPSPALP